MHKSRTELSQFLPFVFYQITVPIFFVQWGIKFRVFNFRGTFFSQEFDFANFFQSRKSQNLVLAKMSKNKVIRMYIIGLSPLHLVCDCFLNYRYHPIK